MKSRDWPNAIRFYRRHLRRWGKDSAALVQYAHALKESDDLEGAFEAYRRALVLEPQNRDLRLHFLFVSRALGDAARDRMSWNDAVRYYDEYLAREKNDAAILVQYGHALKELARVSEAVVAYRLAMVADPLSYDAALQLGFGLLLSGDRQKAIHAFGKALELSDESENEATAALAQIVRQQGTHSASIKGVEPGIVPPPSRRLSLTVSELVAGAVEIAALVTKSTKLSNDQANRFEAHPAFIAEAQRLLGLTENAVANTLPLHNLGPVLPFLPLVPTQLIDPTSLGDADHILPRYERERQELGLKLAVDAESASSQRGRVRISVLMPTFNSPSIHLQRAILSVLNQTYANWELCIYDDCSTSSHVRPILEFYARIDSRIRVLFGQRNGGISAASNAALDLCTGEFVALLDHDDILTADALATIASHIERNPEVDLLYTDEFKVDEDNIITDLFAKPDWSPTYLLNYMYTGHLSVYRAPLIKELRFRSAYDFSQDYDLALRAAARENLKVVHVEQKVYGWRMVPGSGAQGDKPDARRTNVAALQSFIEQRGWKGNAIASRFANEVRFDRTPHGRVSIIVPSDNVANIEATIASIVGRTTYADYEILIVTRSEIAAAVRARPLVAGPSPIFVPFDKPYNFSAKCNAGAAVATGEFLVFYNDDVRVRDGDWVESILDYLSLPGIGAVGPKLLYENDSIQHAGMVSGVRRLVGTAFHTFPDETAAHYGFAQTVHEVSLICGACLAMRADLLQQIGGWDADNAPIMHSDVDLCFRIQQAGFRCVYTPYASLTHIGHMSIGVMEAKQSKKPFRRDKSEIFLLRQFASQIAQDPYFPQSLRNLVYIDSQEHFRLWPARNRPAAGGKDIIVFSHDLSGSGAPKIAYDVALSLKQLGHYVVVMSPEDGPFRERLLAADIDVIIDATALHANNDLVDLAKNFDLAVCNTVVTWRIVKALSPFIPVHLYAHEAGLIDHLAAADKMFLKGLASATKVLAGSELSVTALARHGISSEVLSYGVDDPILFGSVSSEKRDIRSSDNVSIALFGTVEPRKGQDLAVLAYLALPAEYRAKCTLKIVGRINDVGFAEQVGYLAANEPGIKILKDCDLDEYRCAIKRADVILCPSRDDTLPLVTLDALAHGKVLICSHETGTSRYILDGESGFIPVHNSPDDIATTLRQVIDRTDRAEIGHRARCVFEENFTRGVFDRRLRNVIGI
ncbi:glycosyltransferase [Lichenihabitans psoromatis]|uniref:glycosyltransferase n=1 Tax=Lichenihabitans psoromatis TaxID=2528642 RepID=UPI0013F161E5|nr:glycosyltransferase [Lichenihabitans psoromatis]